MKKILLIGSGAREHVIAETLKKSPQGVSIFTYAKAKNPGIAKLSDGYELGDLKDFEHLKTYAQSVNPDFAFIGPDDPIGDGMADVLLEVGIKSVAPLKTVARVESSKSFTRDLVAKYQIPGNPKYRVFFDMHGLKEYIEQDLGGEYVVKADGLMGGKGVKVSGEHLKTVEEGLAFSQECLTANGRVVIEEKFVGQEFSLMSFCDGETVVPMPAVQDHKRAFAGDLGPNTGGMGSYSDANHLLPFMTQKDVDDAVVITELVMKALKAETGVSFTGILYGGFIAVKDGVRLIEFNARFGDPEAMNVLPLLETDFVEVCEGILNGTLQNVPVSFAHQATVCKYIVPEGYPENPKKGEKITVGEIPAGVKMYYSSVEERGGEIFMSSSRAIGLVGMGASLEEAEKMAESAVKSISGPIAYRADIGTKELIRQRVHMMEHVRGSNL